MANVKIYETFPHIFVLALFVSDIIIFNIFDLQKVDQGHGIQFWKKSKSTKYAPTFWV